MSWTLIFIAALVIGVAGIVGINYVYDHTDADPDVCEVMNIIAWIVTGLAAAATIGAVICIICAHSPHVQLEIARKQEQYEMLEAKKEALKDVEISDTVRIQYSEIITEIKNWNTSVLEERYKIQSPWTNWFHNAELVNSLNTVDYQ